MVVLGVLLIVLGVVVVLGGTGMLRTPSGGSKGLDLDAYLEKRMKANSGYPASSFTISDGTRSISESTNLLPMQGERYGAADVDDMIEELNNRGGDGPGPNHPG